ncbi:hypothetical protein [Gemmatimonas groenlandica]|uniref:Cohesin domain-containing protein n=1 Tax=Gemmatimonas groenlandica TaxID=2732249 RepID=A0A6M4IRX4_9BACT|nr:hypothetical protein [Gemmatimonas groenlandica]QJR36186.1 hypothetical protein HKW67_12050 [Gemmatimonas groenlandica]
MRRNMTAGWRVAAVLSFALAASACRDTLGDGAVNPLPSTQATAQLVITPAMAGDSVITVDVRVSGLDGMGASSSAQAKAVSMTAAVAYDTTQLRYLTDASPSDGALRAVNAGRGRVMIAAAHATGFTSDVFARVRFVARSEQAAATLSLQLSELHLSDATDVRERLTVLPTAVLK